MCIRDSGNAVRELLLRTELRHAALFAVSNTLRIERCSDCLLYTSIAVMHWVGERRMRGEVRAEALVDCIRVRMPE